MNGSGDDGAALAELQAANATLHEVLAQLPALVSVTVGPEHRFVVVSPATRAAFGSSAAVGHTVADALGSAAKETRALERYDHVYRTGERLSQRVVYRLPTASAELEERIFDTTLLPYRAADGSIRGVIGFALEVTAQVRAEERRALLTEASRLLAETLDVGDALDRLTSLIVPRLADNVIVTIRDEHGAYVQLAERSNDPRREALLRRIRELQLEPSETSPSARVIASGQPIFVPRIEDSLLRAAARTEEHLALLRQLNARSLIAVPLVAAGRVLGAINFGLSSDRRHYDAEDLALAEEIGRRSGVAFAHARLHRELLDAREREAFLAEASRSLSESLDRDETLRRIARLAVPLLADVCIVSELTADGRLRDAAHAAVDPEQEEWLDRRAAEPEVPTEPVANALEALPAVPPILEASDATLAAWARNADDVEFYRRWPVRTKVVVPLARGNRALGALRLTMSQGDRRHEPWQRDVAVQLAARAAVALDNARLYREAQAAVERERHSRDTLATVVDSSPLAVMLLDRDGTVRMWNRAAEQIYGWTASEVLGRFLPASPDEAPADLVARLGRIADGEALAEYESRRLRRDGVFDALIWAAPVRSPNGTQILSVVADVTERKRVEAAAAQGAQRLAILADVSRTFGEAGLEPEIAARSIVEIVARHLGEAAALCVLSADGDALQLLAVHGVRASGDREFGSFPPRIPLEGSTLGRVVTSGEPLRATLAQLIGRSDGSGSEGIDRPADDLTREWIVVPLRVHGTVLGTLAVSRATAPRYEAEELELLAEIAHRAAFVVENARLYREAQDATRLRDEFLATVSHELRTPLNAIVGWARLAREQPNDRALVTRAIETIDRNTAVQAKLIEDLLDVSRIITGKLRLERRSVSVADAVRAAIDVLAPSAQARRIRLRTDIAPDVGIAVADPARLQQIAWNLLSNAIKFSPDGGEVRLSLAREHDEIVLTVSDDGIGFESSFAPHLFHRFRQANAQPGVKGGLGLGLAIVRHLAELHGGRVRAHSEGPNRGATFEVRFHADAEPDVAPPSETRPVSSPPVPAAPRLHGVHVLVAEDDADTRAALVRALSDAGARVREAENGEVALELFDREPPDVVVSDIAMPRLDGYALARSIRQRSPERGGEIPILAITAFARAEDAWRAREAGFSRHVAKPIDGASVAAILADLSGR